MESRFLSALRLCPNTPTAGMIIFMMMFAVWGKSPISLYAYEDGLLSVSRSQSAPAFILKTMDGREVVRSRDIFSKKELTVLIFWNSYCPDCLKAVADCQKFYRDSKELNVGLWSINFDDEKLSDARRFLEGERIIFPVLSDRLGAVARKYKAEAYDFSLFIIARDGIIQYVHYDHPPNAAEFIKVQVEKLLKRQLKVSEPAPSFVLKTFLGLRKSESSSDNASAPTSDESKVVKSKEAFSQKELTVLIFWKWELGYAPAIPDRPSKCLDAVVQCQEFHERSEELGIAALSINFDEDPTRARDFVKEKSLTFPILSDTRGVVPKLYRVEDYCFSLFIIDKKGIIRYICYDPPSNIVETIKSKLRELRSVPD